MYTTLYIIRHCEAEGNIKEVFQGFTDSDITERGRLQLECLGRRFREIPLDVIYASPLKRARLTAEAVRGHSGVPIIPIIEDPRLKEINAGKMEGERWDKLPELFPNEYGVWLNDIGNFTAPGGESTREVYDRMKAAVTDIICGNAGRTVALVSHGCAIYMLMAYLNGYSRDEISKRTFWCNNTAVSRVVFGDNLVPKIELFGDTSHTDGDERASVRRMRWLADKEKTTLNPTISEQPS